MGGWFWRKQEVHIGMWVRLKLCRLKNGQDGSCFCRGLQGEIWVRPIEVIGRGERLVVKGKG